MVAGACGGIVRTESEPDGGSGGGSTGAGASSSGGLSSGAGGKPTGQAGVVAKGGAGVLPLATCGNGKIDPGEDCDAVAPLAVTCSTATMGTKPVGLIRCSKTCVLDTSGCKSGAGGATGTGGVTGRGGVTGTGGVVGAGGKTAPATFETCIRTPTILSSDCTQTCGCKVCPDAYAACEADGGCSWILSCAHQTGCVSIDDCYQTSCAGIIDRAGGRNSVGAKRAGPALACLADNGCGVACQ